MKTYCTVVAVALGLGMPAAAQDKGPPAGWKEWGVLGSDDIAFQVVAFSPRKLVLAAGQYNGEVRLWNAVTGLEERRLESAERKRILALRFDAEGTRLCAAGETGFAAWDLTTGKRLVEQKWPGGPAVAAAVRPDGQAVALATAEGRVLIWNVAAGKKELTLEAPGGNVACDALAFSPDGDRVAGGTSGGTVFVWDAATGKPLATLEEARGPAVRAVAFAPDGKRLLAVRGREPLLVWDLATAKVHKRLSGDAAPY